MWARFLPTSICLLSLFQMESSPEQVLTLFFIVNEVILILPWIYFSVGRVCLFPKPYTECIVELDFSPCSHTHSRSSMNGYHRVKARGTYLPNSRARKLRPWPGTLSSEIAAPHCMQGSSLSLLKKCGMKEECPSEGEQWNTPSCQVFTPCAAQPGVRALKSNDCFREYFILKASEWQMI